MTNMEYTQPVVIDLNECKKEGAESNQKGEKSGSKLKELINRFVGERASKKKDKSELRFRGISGEDATGKARCMPIALTLSLLSLSLLCGFSVRVRE
jgi:hypothetical protein